MTFTSPRQHTLTPQQQAHSAAVQQALRAHVNDLHSILSSELQQQSGKRVDFSVNDTKTDGLNISEPEIVQPFIQQELATHNVGYLFGGYNTERATYHSDLFDANTESRNIHLAYDVWLQPETPLYTPLPAIVHSVHNNNYHLDYGPTVILQHTLDGITFWSLYGHLQTRTLAHIAIGQQLVAGERFAWIGYSTENIGWTPHVHAQIITDLLGNSVDFPGLCTQSTRDFYTTLCPDPGLLFQLG